MPLKEAVAKLWIMLRTAALWSRANRVYDRAIKHFKRGMALKMKGDEYSAKATAIEKQNAGVSADG